MRCPEWPDVGERHAREFRLASGKAAGEMRVAKRARGGAPHHLLGERGIRIRVLAEQPVVMAAPPAVAARDSERDHQDHEWRWKRPNDVIRGASLCRGWLLRHRCRSERNDHHERTAVARRIANVDIAAVRSDNLAGH